jgi:hypothetical protein
MKMCRTLNLAGGPFGKAFVVERSSLKRIAAASDAA